MSYLEKLLDGAEVEWMPLGEVLPMRAGQHNVDKDGIEAYVSITYKLF